MSEIKDLIKQLTDSQIIEIVTSLGADRYQYSGNAIIFPTICHNTDSEDSKLKLYYYPKTKTFHCYTDCGCTFNIIELFKKRYEILGIDYNFYKDIILKIGGKGFTKKKEEFLLPYESLYKENNNNIKVNVEPINKGLLNIYSHYAATEWLNDGISKEVMNRYNIMYSISENKIIIPHYNLNGELIGIRGRALNPDDLKIGKYLPVKIEGKIYSHPLGFNLYGLNFVKDNIKKYKMAIIAESEKSCLQYETMFGEDRNIVVASCGSSFHKYQLDLLLKCGAERVLIAFDKEGKTWKEKTDYYNKLKNLCLKYKNYCNMGFIIDTEDLLKLKQSPFDCGPEVTKKLIAKGVWL